MSQSCHIPTPSFIDSPGDIAVNKEYVDERDEILLRQDIIELEEEIDAIAPSLEYVALGHLLYLVLPSGAGICNKTYDLYLGTFFLIPMV